MGTLDFVLNEVENKFDIPDANAKSLLSGLLGFINQQARGLAGVLDRIREAGLGDSVSSWLGGDPKPISPEGLETALGGRGDQQYCFKSRASAGHRIFGVGLHASKNSSANGEGRERTRLSAN